MNDHLLHAYLDGEVTAEQHALVERALASDPALAEELARLVAMNEALGDALPDVRMSETEQMSETELARAAIARGKLAERGRIFALVSGVAAAAAVIALVMLPRTVGETPEDDWFSADEQMEYVYWETDGDTYGSGDLEELEDEILEILETT